jgi:hypothetical protein
MECASNADPAAGRTKRWETHLNMASTAQAIATRPFEDFASLLDETLGRDTGFDGSVVTGRVVRLTDEFAIVDVGLKSEGRVALKEFAAPGMAPARRRGGKRRGPRWSGRSRAISASMAQSMAG